MSLYAAGMLLGVLQAATAFCSANMDTGASRNIAGAGNAAYVSDSPEGTDHILFNHGAVTPISEDYCRLIQRSDHAAAHFWWVGLPFLICGLVGYHASTPPEKRHRRRMYLFMCLFVPLWRDPAPNFFAKCYFLLLFAEMFYFDVIADNMMQTEAQFIHYINGSYAVLGAIALAATGLHGKCRPHFLARVG